MEEGIWLEGFSFLPRCFPDQRNKTGMGQTAEGTNLPGLTVRSRIAPHLFRLLKYRNTGGNAVITTSHKPDVRIIGSA